MGKLSVLGSILSAIASASACDVMDSAAEAAAIHQPQAVRVRMVPVTHGPILRTLRVAGMVRHKSEFDLAFKLGGVVRRVSVEEGARVRRGQVLAVVDATEVRALRRQAGAAVAKAERDLARARQLAQTNAVGRADLENSETLVAMARADAERASFSLKHTALVAPEAGVIDWRRIEVGEIVAPGQAVFRLLGTSRGAVVRAELGDHDALALALGQPARVFIDAHPRDELSARVSRIATSGSIGTGMLAVELKLDRPPPQLPSGVTAKVELETVLNATAKVPVSALTDGNAVFALEGDQVRRVPVQVELLSGDHAALTGELGQLTEIVDLGAAALADGDRVQVVQ